MSLHDLKPRAAGDFPRTIEALQRQVEHRMHFAPDDYHGDFIYNPDTRERIMRAAVKQAAVLIGIIERTDSLHVLLTKRLDSLRTHGGQIAFPGGRVDPTDPDIDFAALREAHEEVSLDPAFARVLGRLPEYLSGSGYRITPVIAAIDPHAKLAANPQEVDYYFEVPLAFLMDPANHHRASRTIEGRERYFFEMPYGDHYIWGVTAGILKLMHERLFA